MTLATCRECQREVSTEARTCPHCRAPRPALAEWRGTGFEWKSERTFWGYPLVHVAVGRDSRGKLRVAKGVIAVGQFAVGAVTLAQFGIGLVFGFGQFILGGAALAQLAISPSWSVGQLAVGYYAIGQLVLAYLGLAQVGWAKFLWSPARKDPEAVQFFTELWEAVKQFL